MSDDSSGFDLSAGSNWIYPTNKPKRDYQFNIVQAALFKNTLVCLPTGLGKTFIAAVVMYNFYRWYPSGKVVFMTPTRPLVAQQIEACYTVMGIPEEDMTEMTGTQSPITRAEMWKTKRVFFLTPQVFTNDLARGLCEGATIRCLVIDEAHKAQKNHSYCQAIQSLCLVNNQFRVLALSATPGNDIKDVQQVINNILISHVEIRSEESIDVQPYTHHKKIEKILVSVGDNLGSVIQKYLSICAIYVNRLIENRALFAMKPENVTKFMLIKGREKFRETQHPQFVIGRVESDFATAISLYHGFELAQLHGPRSLYNHMYGVLHGDKVTTRLKNELSKNPTFVGLFNELSEQFDPNKAAKNTLDGALPPDVHPKMRKLDEIILKHFMDCQQGEDGNPKESRVIIFAQYRDTVDEIKRLLDRHRPLVKPVVFIGHGGASSSEKTATSKKISKENDASFDNENSNEATAAAPGRVAAAKMSQKEQMEIMERFKRGDFNTLVATSIVEEGLDIGEVDLIICYDQHRSPIRLVQRMGRTGRKRDGKCVMLVTEGREDQAYEQGLKKRLTLIKSIQNAKSTLSLYKDNPRMVPINFQPKPLEKLMVISEKKMKVGAGKGRGRGRASVTTAKKTFKTTKTNKKLSKEAGKFEPPDDNLSPILEDALYNDSILPESDNGKNNTKAQDIVVIDLSKPSTSKRKISKLERTESNDHGVTKQRKVYEFFAGPAMMASESNGCHDDVVFVENAQVSNLATSLKNKLISLIENYSIRGAMTKKFNEQCFSLEPNNGHENSYFALPPPTNASFGLNMTSWNDFDLESYFGDVINTFDDLDFKRMVHDAPMFFSPLGSKSTLNYNPSTFASTPKVLSVKASPRHQSFCSFKAAIHEEDVNEISNNSELGLTQALDILSAKTPAPQPSIEPMTNPRPTPPVTAQKASAPSTAVRNRYISPIIESLAAAFKRKQLQTQKEKEAAAAISTKDDIVNFDLGFDLEVPLAEPAPGSQMDDSPVNFEFDFDFVVDDTGKEAMDVISTSIRHESSEVVGNEFSETFKTEVPPVDGVEAGDEPIDDQLLAMLATDFPESDDEKFKEQEDSSFTNCAIAAMRSVASIDAEHNTVIASRPTSEIENWPKPQQFKSTLNDQSFSALKNSSFKAPVTFGLEMSQNSPVIKRPKAGKRAVFDDTVASSSRNIYDDDDDFKSPENFCRGKSIHNVSFGGSHKTRTPDTEKPSPVVRKAKKPQKFRMFLETQAVQSDSGSEDDDCSDDDRDISSLIDNNHHSPTTSQDHAMYLRMQQQHTPAFGPGRFKLVYKNNEHNASPIFSQTPGRHVDETWDDYEEDSFCVDDEYVEFEESSQALEYMSPSQPLPRTRGARRKLQQGSKANKDEIKPVKKRKVIISDDESGDEPSNSKPQPIDSQNNNDQEDVDLMIAIARSLEDQELVAAALTPPRAQVTPHHSPQAIAQPLAQSGDSFYDLTEPGSPVILSQSARRQKIPEPDRSKLVISVSSVELQSAQSLVSELRATYASELYVLVRSTSLPCLEYTISGRCAAMRVKSSLLIGHGSNGQTRKKIIDDVTTLAANVDFPVVIIEDDLPENFNKLQMKQNEPSKYFANPQVARFLSTCFQINVRILHSNDTSQTASFLADLVRQEDAEGMAIRIDEKGYRDVLNANPAAASGLNARMKFFESVGPSVTPLVALKLAVLCPSLQHFCASNFDLRSFSTCARQALTRLRAGAASSNNNNNNNNYYSANSSTTNHVVNQAARQSMNNHQKVSTIKQSSSDLSRRF